MLSSSLRSILFMFCFVYGSYAGAGNAYTKAKGLLPLREFETKSYYICETVRATYFESIQICNELGMQLASIPNKRINKFLFKSIAAKAKHRSYWTSGIDLYFARKWIWLTTGRPVTYTNFEKKKKKKKNKNKNEPNNVAERCLEVKKYYKKKNARPKDLKWNRMDCRLQFHFICESRNADERNPPTNTSTPTPETEPTTNSAISTPETNSTTNTSTPIPETEPTTNSSISTPETNLTTNTSNPTPETTPTTDTSISTAETTPTTTAEIHCYYIGREEVSYKTAIEKCECRGLKLVSIQNEAKQEAVEKFIKESGYKQPLWITGKNISDKKPDETGNEGCMTIMKTDSGFAYNSPTCDFNFGYICQSNPVPHACCCWIQPQLPRFIKILVTVKVSKKKKKTNLI